MVYKPKFRAIDLFAGGGGVSHGIYLATGSEPLVAVNHSAAALAMHAANHRNTIHVCKDVREVEPFNPIDEPIDLLWASVDCTHHSSAKGAKPLDADIRGLCWSVFPWLKKVRPCVFGLENVPEFANYGPLYAADDPVVSRRLRPIPEQKGTLFKLFVRSLEKLGYTVEWRVLLAADYGAPTIRRRLVLIARCDGEPIVWPKPTHGTGPGLKPHRAAAECIDWSIPCPSIFTRKKPLAEKTLLRIARGVEKFVLTDPNPFIVGDAVPNLVSTRNGERKGQAPRVRDIRHPYPTVTAQGSQGAIQLSRLVRGTVDTPGVRRTAAFLSKYYGQGTGQSVREPLHTILSKARFALVTVEIAGVEHTLCDIGYRMLTPRELARAQGFSDSYILTGGVVEQTARIGNSVPPQLAAAVVGAQFGVAPWA